MARIRLAEWDEFADLIEQALDRPAAERRRYLRVACAGDDARLSTAERLLTVAEQAAGFLEEPASVHVAELLREAVTGKGARTGAEAAAPPERIGPYRVVRELGRGGMGEVYLAERDDDEYRRQVAIKVVRSGFGTPEMARRFRDERQILASLDHANIARLYDGGVTEDGRPYFVMEYVEGQAIDRHCDERGLDIDSRLELFAQVCGAVAYAHRKLVVHRDLKPANILIDANGGVKLLDFGVAKLLETDDDPDGQAAPVTRAGFRVLTPEYASPEQFLGAPVSTATDVYSLGVLLFELLAGRSPYRIAGTGARAVEQAVLDGERDRPSVAFSRREEPGTSAAPTTRAIQVALNRDSTPDRLRRLLHGDLDTIALTALRKEPDQRYVSADALLEDVRRHRAKLPIIARPQTWSYRTGRYLRRNRLGVAMAGLLAASLVVGTVTTLWQARAATIEAEKAGQIRDFLVGIFEVSDPDQSRGETVTARELLDNGANRVTVQLAGQPEVRAGIQAVLGTVYRRLGLFDDARGHLESALDLRRSTDAGPHELAESLTDLAALYFNTAEYDEAETLQREALEIRRRVNGAGSPEYAAVSEDLAGTLSERAEYDDARPLYETALRIQEAAGDSLAVASVLSGYGLMLARAGEVAESTQRLRRAVELRKAAFGSQHTSVASSLCNLASSLKDAGDYDGAESAYAECLAVRRSLLAANHPDIGLTLNNLALVADERGDLVGSDSLHHAALEIRRSAFGEFHPEVAGSLNNIAVLAYRRGDLTGAAETFREVLSQWRELLGDDHPNTLTTLNNLGMTLSAAGDLGAAESVLRESLAARRKALGDAHPQVAESYSNLTSVLQKQGRFREAEVETRTAIAIFDAAYPDGHPNTAGALVGLARALRSQGRCADAIPSIERAVAIRVDRLGADHTVTADARVWLGRCLSDTGRIDEAVAVLQTAHAALVAANGEDHDTSREAAAVLAEARRRRQEPRPF